MNFATLKDRGTLPIHLGGVVACAVLLGAGWFFGLGPLMTESHEVSSVIAQAAQADEQARASKARLDQLSAKLDAVRTKLEKHPVSLSAASDINPLLAQLAQWADRHNLGVTGTRAGRPIALAYYDYLPITLSGEGSYTDLLGYLHQINTDRTDLGVVSFNITRMVTSGGVSFEIELAWYVISDVSEPVGGSTAGVPTP